MNGPGLLTPYDATPSAALKALAAHDGPLLLDFDETLYLRNSTEDFLDSARPALAAFIVLALLHRIKPWRWTGGDATRDVWRLRVIQWLFPWTLPRWRRQAVRMAQRHINTPLYEVLRGHATRPTIVTLGFDCVVAPLVAGMRLEQTEIVATRSGVYADRLRGKLPLSIDALGPEAVQRALVLTDSIDDLPLLKACAKPLRTLWPQARYDVAHSGVYLPGRYLTRIKRPGERYILRGILQDDFAFWLLASLALAGSPLLHTAGLLFLLLSFWSIYECGYVDNDRIAALFEKDPKLSVSFGYARVATPTWAPWIWATVSGVIALLLLRWPQQPLPQDFAAWTLTLLATFTWFRFYNRFDKSTRVWLYVGLQIARTAAFVVLVPVAVIGAAAMAAHVLAKWVPYCFYRTGAQGWPEASLPLTRLLFFLVIAAPIALTRDLSLLLTWTAAALLGWNLFRARHDLAAVLKRAHRLDQPTP